MGKVKVYKFAEGEVYIQAERIYYQNPVIKKKIEAIFDEINDIKLRFIQMGNLKKPSKTLDCLNCFHADRKDRGLYCNLRKLYVDKDIGSQCIFHSQRTNGISDNVIFDIHDFVGNFGELKKDKILENLSANPTSFELKLSSLAGLLKKNKKEFVMIK